MSFCPKPSLPVSMNFPVLLPNKQSSHLSCSEMLILRELILDGCIYLNFHTKTTFWTSVAWIFEFQWIFNVMDIFKIVTKCS